MFNINKTPMDGLLELVSQRRADDRGFFFKTFNEVGFKEHGLHFELKEQYYSLSQKNVFRGMHFQLPPWDHQKIVHCISGQIIDIVIDLRKSSKTFGQTFQLELSENKANMLFIPKGFAHGFFVLSSEAIVLYNVDSIYQPNFDTGIHWKSTDFQPPSQEEMIISPKDHSLKPLSELQTPWV